jgi:hypothetical protein
VALYDLLFINDVFWFLIKLTTSHTRALRSLFSSARVQVKLLP